ncbi:MAG: YfjI family protein [Campylobacterota bacterium]|nr:YfjI family protein [Campylobacterota bacterium]
MGFGLKIADMHSTKEEFIPSIDTAEVVGTTDGISDEDYTIVQGNTPADNTLSSHKKYTLLHFTEDMVPEPLRRWTLDNCMQAEGSLNYGAVGAIITAGTLIGYRVRVKPKRNPEWKVTPNLWGMAIGEPSARKSPVIDQFLKPLHTLQKNAHAKYEENMKDYQEAKIHHDLAVKAQKKALQKAYDKEDMEAIEKAKEMKIPYIGEVPVPERFIINDATTESIGTLSSTSQRTILQYRDELAGFFASFQKPGREGDRAFFLEAFQGDRSYSYDRVGRGTIHIKNLSLSLFGTIQPSVLPKYILSKGGNNHDGLAQRMQLTVFSDDIFRPYMDQPIDFKAKEQAYEILKELAYVDYEVWGAINDPHDEIPYFMFDSDAQKCFIRWYKKLKEKESEESNLNVQAHIGKYYSLLPSLALIFFLIDKAVGTTESNEIEVSHVQMAEKWCSVLETHARKMYALTTDSLKPSLTDKIINFVQGHSEKLPATYGEISGLIRGAKAGDVEHALQGKVELEGKTVMQLVSNV